MWSILSDSFHLCALKLHDQASSICALQLVETKRKQFMLHASDPDVTFSLFQFKLDEAVQIRC